MQESNGDLTRVHYFSSPPIERLKLTVFLHTRKILPVLAGFEPMTSGLLGRALCHSATEPGVRPRASFCMLLLVSSINPRPGSVAEWHSALPSKPEVVVSNFAETGTIFWVCKNPVSVALSEGS